MYYVLSYVYLARFYSALLRGIDFRPDKKEISYHSWLLVRVPEAQLRPKTDKTNGNGFVFALI